jgi:cell division protein YceG involved in septum cleavage
LKKRVDEKWAVWADATACYPYKITHKECTPTFIWQHITDDNAYNLRKHIWLPPTPIGNPSAKTIKATVFYKKTPHYFYLHDNDWVIHYATTNKEHEFNKSKFMH